MKLAEIEVGKEYAWARPGWSRLARYFPRVKVIETRVDRRYQSGSGFLRHTSSKKDGVRVEVLANEREHYGTSKVGDIVLISSREIAEPWEETQKSLDLADEHEGKRQRENDKRDLFLELLWLHPSKIAGDEGEYGTASFDVENLEKICTALGLNVPTDGHWLRTSRGKLVTAKTLDEIVESSRLGSIPGFRAFEELEYLATQVDDKHPWRTKIESAIEEFKAK